MGLLHGGSTQGRRPLFHGSWLPQLVVLRCCPLPHLLVEPLREPPASRPALMGLGRAGPEVGCRFGLRPTKEARGVEHRVSVGGPVRQDSHRGDVVHAVRRNVALLVAIEPVEGESTPRRVVGPPSGLIAGPYWYGGLILQPVAERQWGQLAFVPVGQRGVKRERAAEEPR